MNLTSRIDLEDESSLLNWYPKIQGKIPTPSTFILNLSIEEISSLYGLLDGRTLPKTLEKKIEGMADKMSEPFFLRSDQASGKHEWKNTCFVQDRTKIIRHITRLVEWHAMADMMGVRFNALVFREYLPLQSKFTAFNDMPVAPEWRYFVRDGQPICRHFYWPDDAIVNPSIKNWEPVLHNMQWCKPEEDKIIAGYATLFAKNNPGFWSVDFALTRDSGWVMIDAARGELSWHPAECDHNPDHDKLMAEKDRPAPDFESMIVRLEE